MMTRVGPNQVQGGGFRIRFAGGRAIDIRYREGDHLLVFSAELTAPSALAPMIVYDDASSSRWQPPYDQEPIAPEHRALIVERVKEAIRLTGNGHDADWMRVPVDPARPVHTHAPRAAPSLAPVRRLRPLDRWCGALLAVLFGIGALFMVREHSFGYAVVSVLLAALGAHAAATGRNILIRETAPDELARLEREW